MSGVVDFDVPSLPGVGSGPVLPVPPWARDLRVREGQEVRGNDHGEATGLTWVRSPVPRDSVHHTPQSEDPRLSFSPLTFSVALFLDVTSGRAWMSHDSYPAATYVLGGEGDTKEVEEDVGVVACTCLRRSTTI